MATESVAPGTEGVASSRLTPPVFHPSCHRQEADWGKLPSKQSNSIEDVDLLPALARTACKTFQH